MTFKTGVDDPARFQSLAHCWRSLGLDPAPISARARSTAAAASPRSEIQWCGRACCEAAHIMLTRVRARLAVKQWAERLVRQGGAQKAKVALARKLAVIMHRVLVRR